MGGLDKLAIDDFIEKFILIIVFPLFPIHKHHCGIYQIRKENKVYIFKNPSFFRAVLFNDWLYKVLQRIVLIIFSNQIKIHRHEASDKNLHESMHSKVNSCKSDRNNQRVADDQTHILCY